MSVWIIPDGITEITENYVINNMPEGTTEVVIPEGVKSIHMRAFKGCISLKSVFIPESVKSIGDWAFYSSEV